MEVAVPAPLAAAARREVAPPPPVPLRLDPDRIHAATPSSHESQSHVFSSASPAVLGALSDDSEPDDSPSDEFSSPQLDDAASSSAAKWPQSPLDSSRPICASIALSVSLFSLFSLSVCHHRRRGAVAPVTRAADEDDGGVDETGPPSDMRCERERAGCADDTALT
eukprot:CAMPEP_0197394814 /NCGR_PEP_ID=MMETSP1165-20131217/6166_1 /TAXON_ID=284809 /ORGANISM="Chrysocystis fragilis, Strain CCMP3189" /LENGTH=165 /DNA_ID=CAMNT_0042920551 /DNA_START=1 /DNA_END=496 /DNA_ORIENTATION=+